MTQTNITFPTVQVQATTEEWSALWHIVAKSAVTFRGGEVQPLKGPAKLAMRVLQRAAAAG